MGGPALGGLSWLRAGIADGRDVRSVRDRGVDTAAHGLQFRFSLGVEQAHHRRAGAVGVGVVNEQ